MNTRPLGSSGIQVSTVALGCWPIAGMTSLDVNEADSRQTIAAALEAGINFFDTAYAYGANGESERLVGEIVRSRRDEVVIATKGGLHWENGKMIHDARPERLRAECEESLLRLGTTHVDLLYLHAPDANVPVAESAGALKQLVDEGKARAIGVSNFDVTQLEAFAAVCPIAACQPYYNLLQRDIEGDLLPWCRQHDVAVVIYWPLLKGLLAGKLARDHVFAPGDGRAKYPMFQGQEWQRNQDLLDALRPIAAAAGLSLAQLAIRWCLIQPGITSALCGAKRAYQIAETAAAMAGNLDPDTLAQVDAALAVRGTPAEMQPAVAGKKGK